MGKKARIKQEHDERNAKFAALMNPTKPAPFAVLAKSKGKPETTMAFKGFKKEVWRELKIENDRFYQRQIAAILWAVYQFFGCSTYKLIEFAMRYRDICKNLTDWYGEDYTKEDCNWVFEDILLRETGIDVHKEFSHDMLPPRDDGRDHLGRFKKKEKIA